MTLKAGWAKSVITPGPDVSLMGYEHRHVHQDPGNDGILDDLYCRVTWFEIGTGKPAVWVNLDLCIISSSMAADIRQKIKESFGIPHQRCLISCTHTHSGPWAWDQEIADQLALTFVDMKPLTPDGPEAAYAKTIPAIIIDTAKKAQANSAVVTMRYHQTPIGIAYNRRVATRNGVEMCWNPAHQDHLRPLMSDDPLCTILELRKESGERHAIIAIGAHPVTLGQNNRLLSADWPGAMIRHLEAWIPGCSASFVMAAAGDTHPWLATQDDPAALEIVGRAAAAQAALLLESGGKPWIEVGLKTASKTLELASGALECTVWHLGPLTIIASPTELFAGVGSEIRKRISGDVMLATNTNGWTGYWPSQQAYDLGDYEVESAKAMNRNWEDVEALIEGIANLARGNRSMKSGSS